MTASMIRRKIQEHFCALVLLMNYANFAAEIAGTVLCSDDDRQILFKFKRALTDDYGLLASWSDTEQDCCKWKGVGCSNQTGSVVELRLGAKSLSQTGDRLLKGTIDPSIIELQDLNFLDLSYNDFLGIPIPDFIGYLKKLTYVNLSSSSFSGPIPHQLANLSMLTSLDLSWNSVTSTASLAWLTSLPLLQRLDLSFVNLSEATDWQATIGNLPALKELSLTWCYISSIDYSPPTNSTLSVLNLSVNNIDSSIYRWLSGLAGSLEFVDLSYNQLEGLIPGSVFNELCNLRLFVLTGNSLGEDLSSFLHTFSGCIESSLQSLDLSSNKLTGSLPDLSRFSSLTYLYLHHNNLDQPFPKRIALPSSLAVLDLGHNSIIGQLPELTAFWVLEELYLAGNNLDGIIHESLGQLANLQVIDFSSNFFHGVITEAHFLNLRQLRYLDLSNNTVTFNVSPSWIPPFQLDIINLRRCMLGPFFPKWIGTQKEYSVIDISCGGISDSVPYEFWNFSPRLQYLNASYNELKGTVSDFVFKTTNSPVVDLKSNHFEGPLQRSFAGNVASLSLSGNRFTGSLSFLCSISKLSYLDLSDNQFSGNLPDCWMNLTRLIILRLDRNRLTGGIPRSISSLRRLRSLHLRNNLLAGNIPSVIGDLRQLMVLDLGKNQFSGSLPEWVGEKLSDLVVLSLASNHLTKNIPMQLCRLTSIRVLDISENELSGGIPACVDNFKSMIQMDNSDSPIIEIDELDYPYDFKGDPYRGYVESERLKWKGKELQYTNTLGLVKILDLSSNNLTGNIPQGMTSLVALVALNLSRNNLAGEIPAKIGNLKNLDFLDLSKNYLSGRIPATLTKIDGLGLLNLSYNNLSGEIPTDVHLRNFGAYSYIGNEGLCGQPLPTECSPTGPIDGESEEDDDSLGGLSVGLGFTAGFWGFCCTLLFSSCWRHAYFDTLTIIKDWLCCAHERNEEDDDDHTDLPLTFYDHNSRSSRRAMSNPTIPR